MIDLYLQAKYLFPRRLTLWAELHEWHRWLSPCENLIAIRKFHRVLDETIIGTDYRIIMDGEALSECVFIEPYARRAFAHLIANQPGPLLLNSTEQAWQFCDAGIQCLAHVFPGSAAPECPPANDPNSPPETPLHPG